MQYNIVWTKQQQKKRKKLKNDDEWLNWSDI